MPSHGRDFYITSMPQRSGNMWKRVAGKQRRMTWNAALWGSYCHCTQELTAALVTHPRSSQLKMATEMGRSYQVTTSWGAAGSWWWFPGDWEALFHKVWPLVGKSCSRGDRTLMHMWTSLTGLSGLFRNNGEQLWKETVWWEQESLQESRAWI